MVFKTKQTKFNIWQSQELVPRKIEEFDQGFCIVTEDGKPLNHNSRFDTLSQWVVYWASVDLEVYCEG